MSNNHDQRQGGMLGGQYINADIRKSAGVSSTDSDFTVQHKVYQHNTQKMFDALSASNEGIPKSNTPDPVFGDPDVQKGLFKAVIWIAVAIFAFCLVFFGGAVVLNKVTSTVSNTFVAHNSDNFEYRATQNFGLLALLESKSGETETKNINPTKEQIINSYKNIYGNTFSDNDYINIANLACSNVRCEDIAFPKLREFAVKNHKELTFDKITAKAINTYWSKTDSKNRYDYQVVYGSCPVNDLACYNRLAANPVYVGYRNILEKPL